MSYQTGTAATPAALIGIINTFAAANGWTNTAGVLSSGAGSFIEMTTHGTYPLESMFVAGATNVNMVTGLSSQKAQVWIPTAMWPVTYHLQSHTTPGDLITCFVQYDGIRHQWLAFGDATKYGTWTGGNWFGASCGQNDGPNGTADRHPVFAMLNSTSGPGGAAQGYTAMPGAPFWGCRNIYTWTGGYLPARNSFVHCEVDGNIWPGTGVIDGQYPNFAGYANMMISSNYQPNTWDGHAVLIPFWLIMNRADGNISILGELPNLRMVRCTYIDPGEIITIGADKWMVFPWISKDSVNYNAYSSAAGNRSSGTWGIAIKYDGP